MTHQQMEIKIKELEKRIYALEQASSDCRICKKWNECPCGKEGHENGTSIGYSVGECREYEQQPCEDAISRQAVINTIHKTIYGFFDVVDDDSEEPINDKDKLLLSVNKGISNAVKALSSVTPQQKIGQWVSTAIQGEIDGQIVKAFTCSECGAISIFRTIGGKIVNGDLCPNCGAKMVEPQERNCEPQERSDKE